MNHKDIIKQLMNETNTTQTELGARLGIRQTAVSNYLNREDMMFSTFARIIDALGYDFVITPKE